MAPSEVPETRLLHVEARAKDLKKRDDTDRGGCALRACVGVHRNAVLQLS